MKFNKDCTSDFHYIAVTLKMSIGFFIKQSKIIKLCIICIHGDD